MSNSIFKITNAQVFSRTDEDNSFGLVYKDLYYQFGKFIDHSEVNGEVIRLIDGQGGIVVPGFIDLQLNGGCGSTFSSIDLTNEDITKIGKLAASHGCTSYYATIITAKPEVYKMTLPKLMPQKFDGLPEILGCHLEGPFINIEKKGAHDDQNIIEPFQNNDQDIIVGHINHLFDLDNMNNIKIITIAPELYNSISYIKLFRKRNIIVSCGHSNADLEDITNYIKNDHVNLITHLFNAMTPFNQRVPGIIGLLGSSSAILSQFYYTIIVDSIHVHPNVVNMAYRLHPSGFIMITDGNQYLGCPEGTYQFGSRLARIVNCSTSANDFTKKIVLDEDPSTLAGSMATMIDCFNNFIHFTGTGVVEASLCASYNPAKVMKIDDHKGLLEVGYDADFIILQPDDIKTNRYIVQSTYIGGICGYEQD